MPAPKYPPKTEGVYRITQSLLERYLRCGLYYWLAESTKHRMATVSMLIGSGMAVGAKYDNKNKMEQGRPASIQTIIDATVAGYEIELRLSECPDKKLTIDWGKDQAAMTARTYVMGVSPAIKEVRAVEEPILAKTKGFEIAGTPDVITGDGVGDLKTGQPWNLERANKSRQLSCYALLHKARYGDYPHRVWIDSIYQRNQQWDSARLWSLRQEEHVKAFIHAAEKAIEGIKKGIALPAPEGAWWCSVKWCPNYKRCPAV